MVRKRSLNVRQVKPHGALVDGEIAWYTRIVAVNARRWLTALRTQR
jgi:hypothetical protein